MIQTTQNKPLISLENGNDSPSAASLSHQVIIPHNSSSPKNHSTETADNTQATGQEPWVRPYNSTPKNYKRKRIDYLCRPKTSRFILSIEETKTPRRSRSPPHSPCPCFGFIHPNRSIFISASFSKTLLTSVWVYVSLVEIPIRLNLESNNSRSTRWRSVEFATNLVTIEPKRFYRGGQHHVLRVC